MISSMDGPKGLYFVQPTVMEPMFFGRGRTNGTIYAIMVREQDTGGLPGWIKLS